jgi:hypothetical protein
MFLDVTYKFLWPNGLFPKEIDHIWAALAKWVAAALGAACDPNGRADAGHCPRAHPNGRAGAPIWVTPLEMALQPVAAFLLPAFFLSFNFFTVPGASIAQVEAI